MILNLFNMKCNFKEDYIELYKYTKINKFKNISSNKYQFHSINTVYMYIYSNMLYMYTYTYIYSKNNYSNYDIFMEILN